MVAKISLVKSLRFGRLDRRTIISLLIIVLFLVLIYMNIGASKTEDYGTKEDKVEIRQQPSELDLPNQSDGFNLSQDFTDFPPFNPPSEFYDPDNFDPDNWGGGVNFSDPVDGDFPSVLPSDGFPSFSFPEFTPPTFNPGNGLSNPSIPTASQPSINSPSINQNSNVTQGGFNLTIPERENKARNLPAIKNDNNISIGINLPSLSKVDLKLEVTQEGVVFITLLIGILYLNKKFIPELLFKLEHGDDDETQSKTTEFFVSAPKLDEKEIERIERLKRLVVFKDHVDEIIAKSNKRLDEEGPNGTIIFGYHDLDEAFSAFSKLVRTKDITPLEHAHHQFETGEIDNDRLEEIVNLFYIARFGHRDMIYEDGLIFIEHLLNLVLQREEIDNLEERN